jgi:hypothetical protein
MRAQMGRAGEALRLRLSRWREAGTWPLILQAGGPARRRMRRRWLGVSGSRGVARGERPADRELNAML